MKVYEYKDDKISKSGKKNHLLVLETSNESKMLTSHGEKMYMIFGFYNTEYKGEFIDHVTFDKFLYPKSRRISEETIIIKNIDFIILSKEDIIKINDLGYYSKDTLSKFISHNSILIDNRIIINSKGQYMTLGSSTFLSVFGKNDNTNKDLKIKVNCDESL